MTAPVSSIIFIVGPTAIGKTSLAIELARRIDGEIISADSMQIYKGMRTLSQAPTELEKKRARHHLVGLLDPRKEYSVAEFIKKASAAIASIIKRKKMSIVAGGSGLYVKGLIDGLFPSPEADSKFRSKMERFAAKYGSRKLHSRLSKIDPASAGTIHPNDVRRIIRALEIYHSTGRTMTELKASTRGLKDRYDIRIFGLTRPREELYSQIDARVDKMFRQGIMREVRALARKGMSKTARSAIGYRETLEYLRKHKGKKGIIGEDKGAKREDIEALKELIKTNTRRFAKRQMTWFGADKRIEWFDVSKMSEKSLVNSIVKAIQE